MKRSEIKFTGNNGTFTMNNPHKTSYLYFPLAGENFPLAGENSPLAEENLSQNIKNGIKSAITPLLSGDAKGEQNSFLLQPVSAEELHNLRSTRNFWVKFKEGEAYSATGVSAETEAFIGTQLEEETYLEAGLMWHKIKRISPKYKLESTITSFVPIQEPSVEVMQVTIKNIDTKKKDFTPIGAIPIFGRSADNLRDHRHVTSLLHRIRTTDYGVYIQPELSFDERGHKVNSTGYFVCGVEMDAGKPKGTFPVVEDFIGEGGSFTRPSAVYEYVEPVLPGKNIDGFEAMGGICFEEISLEPGESCSYVIFMGITENNEKKPDRIAEKLGNKESLEKAFTDTKNYWLSKMNVTYQTSSKDFDNFMYWVNFQPTLRRIFGCSFLPHHDYGKGGRGWRDLWQDCLALLIMDPKEVRRMLLDNFAGVRVDGTNATIIGNGSGEFIADRNNITRVWMDHGLWPLMTTEFYIHQTGDIEILMEQAAYFKDQQICRGTQTDYHWKQEQGVWQQTEKNELYKGTLLEHILLENLSVFYDVGAHNHMLLRGADWNDALDMADEKGESVAFSAAYAGNLQTLANICKELEQHGVREVLLLKELYVLLESKEYDNPGKKRKILDEFTQSVSHTVSGERQAINIITLANQLEEMSNWLKNHIRDTEWLEAQEGGFYNGYYDNHSNRVEGMYENSIRMMLPSQVFTVMFGTATDEQISKIVKAADRNLYDASVGGYRLNTDFKELKTDLGRMFGFAYGHKENGAVFSHMAIMYSNALYRRGFAKEGYKVIQTLCTHAADFDRSRIYPGIPEYFNSKGRGMYHYLTGAASWLMMTTVTQMFGIRGQWGDLIFDPKLMPEQFDVDGKAQIELEFAGIPLEITYCLSKEALLKERYKIGEIIMDGETLKTDFIKKEEFIKCSKETKHSIVVQLI